MFKNFNYYYILGGGEDFWFYVNYGKDIKDFYYPVEWKDI